MQTLPDTTLVLLCYKLLIPLVLCTRASNLKEWQALEEQVAQGNGRGFTGLCAWPWKTDDRSLLFTTIATVCFVRTGWGGTNRASFECFVTSTAEKAKAV